MSSEDQYDFLFKIVIVGDSDVGKTQILSRFIDNQFTLDSKPTVGVEFGTKTVSFNGTSIKNQIWDTAGQQRFRALTCAYYRGAVGAIIVFDLAKWITFQNIQKWIKEIKQYSQPDITILIVGNKNDLEQHEVRFQDIQSFSTDHKLIYISTSAATGQNIDLAFETLMKQILRKSSPDEEATQPIQPQINNQGKNQNRMTSQNNAQSMASSHSVRSQTGKQQKRQKPKMQAFSVQGGKKIKLQNSNKNQKKTKKKCC